MLCNCARDGCSNSFERNKLNGKQKYCSIACQDKVSTAKKKEYRQKRALAGLPSQEEPTIWFALIVDMETTHRRKIKLLSHRQNYALRQAYEFCCPGEYVKYLYSGQNKIVWEIQSAEIVKLKKKYERLKLIPETY